MTSPAAGRRDAPVDGGFTAMELIVSLALVGVVILVASPTFFAAQVKAKDAVVQVDLARAKVATIQWRTVTAAAMTPDIDSQLREWGYRPSGYSAPGTAPVFQPGSSSSLFCIGGTSESGQRYSVTTDGPVRRIPCPAAISEW